MKAVCSPILCSLYFHDARAYGLSVAGRTTNNVAVTSSAPSLRVVRTLSFSCNRFATVASRSASVERLL